MLADSSWLRDKREKSISNKDIEIFLIFISFFHLKKVNIEIAGDNGVWTFLSHISQYWTDSFRKSIDSGVVIVTFGRGGGGRGGPPTSPIDYTGLSQ